MTTKPSVKSLRLLYEEGLSIPKIMERVGLSYGVVRRRLLSANTKLRPVGRHAPILSKLKQQAIEDLSAAGWSSAKIGKLFNLKKETIEGAN